MTRIFLLIAISFFSLNLSAQKASDTQRDFTIKLLEEKVNNLQQQIEKSEAHLKELQDAKKEEIEKVMKEKEDALNTRMLLYSGFFFILLSLVVWFLNWIGKKEIRNIVSEFTKTKVDEELANKFSKEVIDAKLTEWGEPEIRKIVEELTEVGKKAKLHEADLAKMMEKYEAFKVDMEKVKTNTDLAKTSPEEKQKVKEFNEITQEVKGEEDFTADDWFWKGIEARQENDFGNAIKYFTKAINLNSDSNYYTNRGFSYDKIGEFDKSIGDYTKAIEIDPKNFVAWNNRGNVKGNLREYEAAINDLNVSIGINSNLPNPYRHRAYANYKLGNLKLSLDDINIAIRLDPAYKEALDLKKEILEAIKNSKN